MPRVEAFELVAGVGEVLGDETLEERFLLNYGEAIISPHDGPGLQSELVANDEANYGRRGVVYEVTVRHDEQPFMSLMFPPPTHLRLVIDTLEWCDGKVHIESLHYYLSTCVSTLIVTNQFTHSLPPANLYPWLLGFLRTQPPASPLRVLSIDLKGADPGLIIQFMEALAAPSCKVLHVQVKFSNNDLDLVWKHLPKLSRCHSVHLSVMGVSERTCSRWELDPLPMSLDVEVALIYSGMPPPREMALLKEMGKLKRLDLREVHYMHGADQVKEIMECVASPSCCIQDLGLNLDTEPSTGNRDADVRPAYLAQAFSHYSSTLYSKLKVLRFTLVNTKEAAQCVVDILANPLCKVRFLDIDIDVLNFCFFSKLREVNARIEFLRASPFGMHVWLPQLHGISDLPSFVEWEDCPLLCLDLQVSSKVSKLPSDRNADVSLDFSNIELDLANALQKNYRLAFLHKKSWSSHAARSRVAALLERNRLYNASDLNFSKQELAKPQVARLFLCGNGEVGKTTIRKALLKLSNPSSIVSQAAACINGASLLSKFMRCAGGPQVEPRTRGLEIHKLSFHQEGQSLVIFDLAGQSDYHVFHHYFMTNTSNDLFMVVCKYVPGSTEDAELVSQMQYWLRFIVSHRNTVGGPNPKVMLVLNFFPPTSPHDQVNMQSTADDITRELQKKYAEVLDFGTPIIDQHVFGISALSRQEIKPILERLGILLTALLKHRPMIPKLCLELSSHILPKLSNYHEKKVIGRGRILMFTSKDGNATASAREVIVPFEQVKDYYFKQQKDSISQEQKSMLEKKLQVALVELHNIGDVIFFPPARSRYSSKNAGVLPDVSHNTGGPLDVLPSSSITEDLLPIITDPGWFCNKVVGNLLAPEEFDGKFKLAEHKVRQVIRENGCPISFLNEMMQYMKGVELCFIVNDYDDRGQIQTHFFFPAVARKKELEWPLVFNDQQSSSMHFYGRRLKCQDTEKYLIPSGVFARLQVQLLRFCSNRSYRMGYRWVSFVKDSIGVMVRFGGPLDLVSSTQMMAHKDDNPEWIDILVCGKGDADGESAVSTEDSIMDGIKHVIFEICQSISRGIPTVVLEEWVLRDKGLDDVIPLAEVEESIRTKGLHSSVAWQCQESTPIVEVLLPMDLKKRMMRQVQAVREIQAEFAVSEDHSIDENEVALTGEMKQLYDALKPEFGKVTRLLEEIKSDVHKLREDLRQMQINIVANCSTQLLKQVLAFKCKLPAYPYLSETDGKLEKLKAFLLLKKARVHFLCESVHGLHIVEGQVGKEVVVDEGVLMKAAPILVPALRVMCCAAMFAVNLYLPGVAPPRIFDLFLDSLKPLGITSESLQSPKIMPRAVNALLDGIDFTAQKLEKYKSEQGMLKMDQGALQAAVESLQNILGDKEDLNMVEDFGLHLIQLNNKPCWVCKEHARGHQELNHPRNPFST